LVPLPAEWRHEDFTPGEDGRATWREKEDFAEGGL